MTTATGPYTGPNYNIDAVANTNLKFEVYTNGKQRYVLYDVFSQAVHELAKYQTWFANEVNQRGEVLQSTNDYMTDTLTSFNAAKSQMRKEFNNATLVYKVAMIAFAVLAAALALALALVLIL